MWGGRQLFLASLPLSGRLPPSNLFLQKAVGARDQRQSRLLFSRQLNDAWSRSRGGTEADGRPSRHLAPQPKRSSPPWRSGRESVESVFRGRKPQPQSGPWPLYNHDFWGREGTDSRGNYLTASPPPYRIPLHPTALRLRPHCSGTNKGSRLVGEAPLSTVTLHERAACRECGAPSLPNTAAAKGTPRRAVSFQCKSCGAILPPLYKWEETNFFEVLGFAPQYNLDIAELEKTFRGLQMLLHPDQHARSKEEQRRFAEEHSREVTLAYRCLKEPVTRARHLLREVMNVEALSEDHRVHDPTLLTELMELNEALMEGDSVSPEEVMRWRNSFEGKKSAALHVMEAALSATHVGPTEERKRGRDEAVDALQKVMFYDKALQRVDEWEVNRRFASTTPPTDIEEQRPYGNDTHPSGGAQK